MSLFQVPPEREIMKRLKGFYSTQGEYSTGTYVGTYMYF